MNWKEYYENRPSMFNERDFFKQVHKTVLGQPITPAQFSAQLADIQDALEINEKDFVLDMACGNGIITKEISSKCFSIVGIDFSKPLIDIAEKYNRTSNSKYFCIAILDEDAKNIEEKPFTKIYMYEALQHFKEEEFPRILTLAKQISSSGVMIFLGGIPDKDRLWDFYDTDERKLEYKKRIENNGTDALGTWWTQQELIDMSLENGFKCSILKQSPVLHSAHYRFDAKLVRISKMAL